jgi:hypothetical protein
VASYDRPRDDNEVNRRKCSVDCETEISRRRTKSKTPSVVACSSCVLSCVKLNGEKFAYKNAFVSVNPVAKSSRRRTQCAEGCRVSKRVSSCFLRWWSSLVDSGSEASVERKVIYSRWRVPGPFSEAMNHVDC